MDFYLLSALSFMYFGTKCCKELIYSVEFHQMICDDVSDLFCV